MVFFVFFMAVVTWTVFRFRFVFFIFLFFAFILVFGFFFTVGLHYWFFVRSWMRFCSASCRTWNVIVSFRVSRLSVRSNPAAGPGELVDRVPQVFFFQRGCGRNFRSFRQYERFSLCSRKRSNFSANSTLSGSSRSQI